jgi:uncharacterized protein (DUF342 family)
MLDFVQLQHAMKERLERDREIRAVETEGATLEDAVAEAATLLNLPVRRIEYEVTVRGFSGFLGSGAKNWKIYAYERVTEKTIQEEKAAALREEDDEVKKEIKRDGEAFVQLLSDGAYLKVIPPAGKGKPVLESAVVQLAANRGILDYDGEQVAAIVREAAGEYVRIGDFERDPTNDAMVVLDLTADEMKAYITVSPAGIGGCDIPLETYLAFLRNNRIVYGIREDELAAFADNPLYKEQFLAAEGTRPVDGRDAYIQYNFEADQGKIKLKENFSGQVDFKYLNIIQNVTEGQPLAVRIAAEKGKNGRTVTGKSVPAKDGRDIVMPLGRNVRAGDDGATIVAEKNGQVLVLNGKINVEEIYTVDGNVDLKSGNIIFLGTVIIKGNVEDGYSVKAAGNIEVHGAVERAELDAEGDIIVHQGVAGKGGGLIRSSRSIWARFIENARVEAGNMVVVSDGIINSQVNAFKRIICQGKRASIVGGRLRATEEINAKSIGSPTSGTLTICEVGFDPKSKLQLENLEKQKEVMEKQLEETQLDIQNLINIKKQRKSLPEEKEENLKELMDKRQELSTQILKNKHQSQKIREFLSEIKVRGKVSVSAKVYPGARIVIREAEENVRNEYKAVTFVLEDDLVKVTKYEEPGEEAMKGPDGYSSN